MSAPGWYPDPSSSGGGYRYWDGSAWTDDRMATSAGQGGPRTTRPWLWFVIAMVVIVAVVAFLILRPGSGGPSLPEDTNSARPTGSQWDERIPTETPTTPEEPGEQGSFVECPRHTGEDRSELSPDGRLHGGGLSLVPPDSFSRQWTYMPGVVDHNSMSKQIVPGWISSVSVAALARADGFNDPRVAATQMMDCIASSSLFDTFTGREDLVDQAVRIDGHAGWQITTNVFVSRPEEVEGDVVDVIVLDTGDPERLAIYVSAATIGLEDNQEEVAESAATLRVEG